MSHFYSNPQECKQCFTNLYQHNIIMLEKCHHLICESCLLSFDLYVKNPVCAHCEEISSSWFRFGDTINDLVQENALTMQLTTIAAMSSFSLNILAFNVALRNDLLGKTLSEVVEFFISTGSFQNIKACILERAIVKGIEDSYYVLSTKTLQFRQFNNNLACEVNGHFVTLSQSD